VAGENLQSFAFTQPAKAHDGREGGEFFSKMVD
jgi:hypothetical protein